MKLENITPQKDDYDADKDVIKVFRGDTTGRIFIEIPGLTEKRFLTFEEGTKLRLTCQNPSNFSSVYTRIDNVKGAGFKVIFP